MPRIALEVTDEDTGKEFVFAVSMHQAQQLYLALRELVGDAQYGAQPGQLITVPDATIKLPKL